MRQQRLIRDVAEHDGGLLAADRVVRAEGRQDVHGAAAGGQRMIADVGEKAGVGMVSREVRGDDEHAVQRPARVEHVKQRLAQRLVGQSRVGLGSEIAFQEKTS